MDSANSELIKHRDILFASPCEDVQPAQTAVLLLVDIYGVVGAACVDDYHLTVDYDITKITVKILEDVLVEVGFHLDNSILSKIKRALYHFTDETQLANMGYDHANSKSTTEIFINRYLHKKHGCRDPRPNYYRHYQ